MRDDILAALSTLLLASACCGTALADDKPTLEGTLANKHEVQVANHDLDTSAQTVGEFMHDYPRGAPGRTRMFPTKQAFELTVATNDGKRVKVVQDKEDSDDLQVGDKVAVDTIEGKQRVIAVK